jgi:hypothetical protein
MDSRENFQENDFHHLISPQANVLDNEENGSTLKVPISKRI